MKVCAKNFLVEIRHDNTLKLFSQPSFCPLHVEVCSPNRVVRVMNSDWTKSAVRWVSHIRRDDLGGETSATRTYRNKIRTITAHFIFTFRNIKNTNPKRMKSIKLPMTILFILREPCFNFYLSIKLVGAGFVNTNHERGFDHVQVFLVFNDKLFN